MALDILYINKENITKYSNIIIRSWVFQGNSFLRSRTYISNFCVARHLVCRRVSAKVKPNGSGNIISVTVKWSLKLKVAYCLALLVLVIHAQIIMLFYFSIYLSSKSN